MRHPTRTTRIPAALGATLLVATLSLTACGGDDAAGQADGSGRRASDVTATPTPDAGQGSSSASASPPPSTPAGTTIDITITPNSVKPNGARVEAKLGEPITLRIQAEEAGELHVHSTPEQEIQFPAGSSTQRLKIDQPGVVDVEDHALEQVVVQLQVS